MVVGGGNATCKGCGYEYNPDKGDPEFPISRGVQFIVSATAGAACIILLCGWLIGFDMIVPCIVGLSRVILVVHWHCMHVQPGWTCRNLHQSRFPISSHIGLNIMLPCMRCCPPQDLPEDYTW